MVKYSKEKHNILYLKIRKDCFIVIHTSQKIRMVKTAEIIPNPYQTRRKFEEKSLSDLALSIKEVGLISPVLLRRASKGYEIICGQRRVRAAIMAGFEEIPAVIVRAGDAQCASLSLIENTHRKNLNFFEEAEGYYNLMAYHRIKKEKLLKTIINNSLVVNEKIQLLALPEIVKRKIEVSETDEKVSKQLLRLRNEDKQIEILEKALKENLSEAEIKVIVDNYIKEASKKEREKPGKTRRVYGGTVKAPLFINTVKKTVELLKRNGAKVEFEQSETEEYLEFKIKTLK